MRASEMHINGRYNWIGQTERLMYLGRQSYPDGWWHQFALASEPDTVWCEVREHELSSFEETVEPAKQRKQEITDLPARKINDRGLDKHSFLSPRQQRKARKAAKRSAQQTQGERDA